jgi:hypothetical protein
MKFSEMFQPLRLLDKISLVSISRSLSWRAMRFDRVKGQVERDCRFHILVARFEIGGYCSGCRK